VNTASEQTRFTEALLDPALPAPDGLIDPQGHPAGKRFNVYRNNVAVALTEALRTAFPVIRNLVGDEFFKEMAGVHLRRYPPKSPLIMFYGADMAAFLSDFEPVAHLGYLPDVARLELALRQSYHAADSAAIDPAMLQTLPTDRLMTARLHLAPSLQVVRSDWPLHAIWRANTQNDAPKPAMRSEDVLITRPEMDPDCARLPKGGAAFVQALQAARPFGQALEEATAEHEAFDLGTVLGLLIAGAGITGISHEDFE